MLTEERLHQERIPPASADLFETAGEVVGGEEQEYTAAPLFDASQAEPLSDDGSRRPEVVRDIADTSSDLAADVTEGKPRKRKLGALVVLLVIAVCGGLSAWFLMGSGGARKARVPVNRTSDVSESEEAAARRAIETVTTPGVTFNDGTTLRPLASPEASPGQVNSIPVTELPSNNTLTTTAASGPGTSLSSGESAPQTSQSLVAKIAGTDRNNERSVQIGTVAPSAGSLAITRSSGGGENDRHRSATAVVPSFGSILPVRSLGVIYTLRSGALARFELTRDVKGKGWMLPRGTVLVGALRGAEHDRAFISLVGFIDADSEKFVRLGGDVLGADGGAGVRGKRRSMSGKWSRVFRRMGEAGLNVAGRVAGGIGRGPVIITDAYGQTAARFGTEFDGIFSDRNKDNFVEVAAGTTCYVMITDLPETIQGVDAVSKLSRSELQEKSDADERRQATGISEREMAELLESGDGSRIRAALPRMTPEMRKLAEAFLAEGGN